MNITDTANVLGLAQAYDNRTVGETNIRAWHAILGDLEAADVMQAIKDHYAGQTEWIMPAHIRQAVAAMRKAREVSPWAPGQHGIPRSEPIPEVTDRITEEGLPLRVRELLAEVRAMLPEGSREALMPRQVAWERQQAGQSRQRGPQPNPHYNPAATAARQECREHGAHDDGTHIETCPDVVPVGGCPGTPHRGHTRSEEPCPLGA